MIEVLENHPEHPHQLLMMNATIKLRALSPVFFRLLCILLALEQRAEDRNKLVKFHRSCEVVEDCFQDHPPIGEAHCIQRLHCTS